MEARKETVEKRQVITYRSDAEFAKKEPQTHRLIQHTLFDMLDRTKPVHRGSATYIPVKMDWMQGGNSAAVGVLAILDSNYGNQDFEAGHEAKSLLKSNLLKGLNSFANSLRLHLLALKNQQENESVYHFCTLVTDTGKWLSFEDDPRQLLRKLRVLIADMLDYEDVGILMYNPGPQNYYACSPNLILSDARYSDNINLFYYNLNNCLSSRFRDSGQVHELCANPRNNQYFLEGIDNLSPVITANQGG